jgi:hypothetical protein
MNIEEFEKLKNIDEIENLITVNDMINKEPRTLIYGYTIDRDTFEIIIDYGDGEIKKFIDDVEYIIESNYDFIPNKRVYPAKSDFEFCKLLIQRGIDIPFTIFE